MATYYMELKQGITVNEIKAKFAAFELLFGSSEIYVKGNVPSLYKNQILPVSLSRAKLVKMGRSNLTVCANDGAENTVIHLGYLYTVYPKHTEPEIMFITVV